MNPPAVAFAQPSRSSVWLKLARLLQIATICLAIGLFIVSIPLNYEQRSIVCNAEPCPPGQLTHESVRALSGIGMSVRSLVSLTIALDLLVAVAYTVCAVLIFIRKPNEWLTIFISVMLVVFGTATFTGALRGFSSVYPEFDWLTRAVEMAGSVSLVAFLLVFPNGRFIPRWTVAVLIGWFLFQLPRYYAPDSPFNLANTNPLLYNVIFAVGILSCIGLQVYRYLHRSNPIEKQQTKWVVYGLAIGVGGYVIIRWLSFFVPDPNGSGLPIAIGLLILSVFFMLLFPISIAVAVVRYRLWDINPIINRTLVYGALSASTIALYILGVGLASRFFQGANFIFAFLATGVIAILFEPLRERLQRAVNRLMYGERDDPATVLTRLSQRLDSALAPDSVLQTIVETLSQTLRLPYAAISLPDGESHFASTTNPPPSELISLPLTYQTERVGELRLAPRAEGESFSTADRDLLNLIARQAGIAVHNLHLTKDLQRSREKLVTAQEEERRRLRRDLHDGVGPTLASLTQRIDVAADLVKTDPEKSIALLRELKGQIKGSVAEIRRLVYALRPPVLDEFGLITAIREHVAPYTGPNGLQVSFDVTDPMPSLPAAIEVAAYRIALEAFTNIVNHAGATSCHIRIKIEDRALIVEVSDDGKGLQANTRSGVGFTSMRERAAELGGDCTVEDRPSGGTTVRARLPITNAPELPGDSRAKPDSTVQEPDPDVQKKE